MPLTPEEKLQLQGPKAESRAVRAARRPGKQETPSLGDDLKISLELVTVPGDKLLIQELDPHSVTPGGIHLPDMSKKKRSVAKVLKLSPQLAGGGVVIMGDRKLTSLEIPAVGDYVTYAKYVTAESVMEEIGPRVCVLNFEDVLAVLKPEAIENAKAETQT